MWKKAIVLLLIVALGNLMYACSKTVKIGLEKMRPSGEKIVAVTMADGEVVKFHDDGGVYSKESNMIAGFVRKAVEHEGRKIETGALEHVLIPADSVTQVWVKRTDPGLTFLAVIGITAGVLLVVGLVAVALKESCPFVYSWDGDKWVFDAEPLGGAICKGLQRSELSRLEHVKDVDGTYRLRLQNEVEETQYLDEMKLVIVDHDAEKMVVPDTSGCLHLITNPVSPTRAYDEQDRDILPFVADNDQSAWQTRLIEKELKANNDSRHHLTFEFDKPADATSARLILNAGTAIWGSNMIREMLQMRGDGVDRWYSSVDSWGPDFWSLIEFNLREEMYLMKVYLDRGDETVQRGMIFGGGPFVAEDRVVEIDVADIPGDKLNLTIHPPKSFWTIDYIAVEYDDTTSVEPRVEEVVTAHHMDNTDISDRLRLTDGDYYVMKEIGEWAEVSFLAPPPPNNSLKRTVFLSTTGYYEVQIDKTRPEQKQLIARLMREPGEIAGYSIERFLQWQEEGK